MFVLRNGQSIIFLEYSILTDEEQHKNIIKDYDMLFEYRE